MFVLVEIPEMHQPIDAITSSVKTYVNTA